ncbi:unnamed protein product [Vicia faba]|uniref:Uncharacterized protein n=1 Tax=Vicia faba TaxID=3906 RepID=A0AAV1ATG1_VICFA|nr:unnamed protein product [Vicia faba]
MKSMKKERGVLKLVHPGRFIEIHREPIIALEVMRRNPRHSITRPDVFKYPWIVVKPESILVPGYVFLIVPNHTIYNLLKAKEQNNNDSLSFQQQHGVRPNWFGVDHAKPSMSSISTSWIQPTCLRNDIGQDSVDVEIDNVNSNMTRVSTSWAQPICFRDDMGQDSRSIEIDNVNSNITRASTSGVQPTCFGDDIGQDSVSVEIDNANLNMTRVSARFSQLNRYSPNYHVDNCKFKYDDWEGKDKLWTKMNSCEDIKKRSMELDLSLDESTSEFTPYQLAVQYYQNQYKRGIDLEMAKKDVKLEFVANEQVNNKLKSCLRKPNSVRKWSNLTVSFDISIKKEE